MRSAPVPPPPAPVIDVAMADHRFDIDSNIPAGRVVFRMRNVGKALHRLVLVPLPDDLPPIAEQLRGSERRLLEPMAGIFDRSPGDIGTFAVDLEPDKRYGILCPIIDEGEDKPHYTKGMASEFRTPPASEGRSDRHPGI